MNKLIQSLDSLSNSLFIAFIFVFSWIGLFFVKLSGRVIRWFSKKLVLYSGQEIYNKTWKLFEKDLKEFIKNTVEKTMDSKINEFEKIIDLKIRQLEDEKHKTFGENVDLKEAIKKYDLEKIEMLSKYYNEEKK